MFSAAKRNAPEPHVGSRTDTSRRGVPKGAQQLRPLALDNDVLGELLDVQVQGDEVIDIVHSAGSQLSRTSR